MKSSRVRGGGGGGERVDINNQIKETICAINLQYYLLRAAGMRGSLVSWLGTGNACDVCVLVLATDST